MSEKQIDPNTIDTETTKAVLQRKINAIRYRIFSNGPIHAKHHIIASF